MHPTNEANKMTSAPMNVANQRGQRDSARLLSRLPESNSTSTLAPLIFDAGKWRSHGKGVLRLAPLLILEPLQPNALDGKPFGVGNGLRIVRENTRARLRLP